MDMGMALALAMGNAGSSGGGGGDSGMHTFVAYVAKTDDWWMTTANYEDVAAAVANNSLFGIAVDWNDGNGVVINMGACVTYNLEDDAYDITGVSFMGSTMIDSYIYETVWSVVVPAESDPYVQVQNVMVTAAPFDPDD